MLLLDKPVYGTGFPSSRLNVETLLATPILALTRRSKLRLYSLHAPSFWRPASVVRNRSDVTNRAHFDSGSSQRAHSRFTPRSRAAHPHIHAADSMIARHVRRI